MTSLTDIFVTVKPDMQSFGTDAKKALGAAAGLFRAAGKDSGRVYTDAFAAASKGKLEELGKKAAAASAVQADALGKLRIAETKLTEVRGNSKAKASQVAAAEEAVAAALRKSTAAATAAKTATASLTTAQGKAKAAADEVAKSQAKGASGNKFAQAFKSSFKPDTSALGKMDGTREGKSVGTRFGAGFNGSMSSTVKRSAALLAATVATVGFGALIKDSVGLEATFSQTMNTMAAVAKVPASEMKSLSDLAIKMGADTTFSAVEAGNAMLELAKGGLSAATISSGGLEGTLTLAAAGGIDLAAASTIASNALNTFGLKGSDMASVAAALAGGANASSASVESLGVALGQVGPGATTAGLSLQETVAALSAFDAAGIKGSDAGTSLKTMLARLVPSTDKAKGAMEDLGLKFTDASGAFVPITNVAQQLKDKLGPLSAAQKSAALTTIFGSDATRAATVLMKEGATGLGKYIAATQDQGAAQKVATARMSGTAGAMEQFKGSVETAKLELGLFLAPAVQGGLKLLTTGVNGIAPAAKQMGASFKDKAGPALRDFGGFITSTVVPALQGFGGFVTGTLVPIVTSLAAEFQVNALPKIREFGAFLVDTLVPAVAGVATEFSSNVLPKIQQFGWYVVNTLIPAVVGFATKIVETVVPTIQNLVGAFAPVVETVGTLVVGAFDKLLPLFGDLASFIADDVLPKLEDFSGFLKDNSDAITAVAAVIATVMIPHYVALGVAAVVSSVKQAGAWVLTQAGAIKAAVVHSGVVVAMVAGWVSTGVAAVASGVVTAQVWLLYQADAIKAAAVHVAQAARVVGGWVLMGVQSMINAARMAAAWLIAMGPVGWVILGVMAVVAAVILLWKKNEGFRNAMIKAWDAIKGALSFVFDWIKGNWPLLLAILTGPIGLAVLAIVKNWDTIKATASTLIDGLKSAFQTGVRAIVGFFLDMVQSVIDASVKAFGWVPGLGGKLKNASKDFAQFRTDTNKSLGGISDQEVKITPIVLAAQENRRDKNAKQSGVGYVTGGPVFGSGTGTSDSIPAMLSNGEHVWTAREVRKAGGHGAVEQIRSAVMGFAKGGSVGFNVKTIMPPLEGPIDNIARVAVAVAKPLAQSLANKLAAATGGPSGPPGSVRNFRGEKLNTRTIAMLLNAEKLLGAAFHITQGSYSTRVAASGGTHSGGGAMDTDGPRGWGAAVSALRRAGFAAWHRTPAQGPWGHHIHSIAVGDSSASASAKRQVADFKRGGDGLGSIGRGMAAGGKVGSLLFDGGRGYLPTGTSLVQNNTGKPEPLTSTDQALDLSDATIRAIGKEFARGLSEGRFRMVNNSGGSYVLQASNG